MRGNPRHKGELAAPRRRGTTVNTESHKSRPRRAFPWRAFVAALFWAFALAAWAQADILAQGEALVRAGRYADAYRLLGESVISR